MIRPKLNCVCDVNTFSRACRVLFLPHGFDDELRWLVKHYGETLDGLEGALLCLIRCARSCTLTPTATTSATTDLIAENWTCVDDGGGGVSTLHWVAVAEEVIDHVSRFASTGDAAAAQLHRVNAPALLTKLLHVLVARGGDVDEQHPVEQKLVDRISTCLANCCGGAGRHLSDLTVAFEPQTAGVKETMPPRNCESCAASSVGCYFYEVHIGFADYSNAETGARLWAGAVVLSALMRERTWVTDWLSASMAARQGCERASRSWRVAEIGCGPALVSAVLLREVERRATAAIMSTTQQRQEQSDTQSRDPLLSLCVTDVAPSAVAEARRTLTHRNRPVDESIVSVCCRVLDFGDVPPDLLSDPFDVVLASDIVYDVSIAKLVPRALVQLLRPATGVAILCCEGHRDGMGSFLRHVEEVYGDELEVIAVEAPTPTILYHVFPSDVNLLCKLMTFRRR